MTNNKVNSKLNVVQFISASTSSVIGATTIIPYDDSIPQNTEGTEVLTLAITPKSATSTLEIVFTCAAEPDAVTANFYMLALFQDSTADALAAGVYTGSANHSLLGILRYIMTSGTTSSTTFKIRAGPSTAGSVYVNGTSAGAATMGGVQIALLTITEYL